MLVRGAFLGRPDGWLVGLGTGWELDSREHHAGEDAFEATLLRSDRFLAAGIPLLHLTPRRVREQGAACVELLVASADRRREAGGGDPEGVRVRPRAPLLTGRRPARST